MKLFLEGVKWIFVNELINTPRLTISTNKEEIPAQGRDDNVEV